VANVWSCVHGISKSCDLCDLQLSLKVYYLKVTEERLCLVFVPLVEGQLMTGRYRSQSRDDVELVHSIVFWLSLLCVYVVVVHVARRQAILKIRNKIVKIPIFRKIPVLYLRAQALIYFQNW